MGALGNDLCRYIGKIGLVGDRRRARGLGHGVDVVGAVAELDAVHVGNQRGPRNAEAQPCTRQIVRFGEGMGDDEIVIFFQKRQTGRPGRRELDVGLVHDHDVVGVRLQHLLDGIHRGQQASGRVRVGNDNRLVQTAVFFQVDGQVSLQRDDVLRDVQ